MLMSAADELAMGRQMNPQVLQTYGKYENADLARYVAALGKKLGALSHQPNLAYSIQVLDSPVVNAFAVPGGYVYLTRGMLAYLNDEAELAGVVAHEIGHIAARHSAQQYSQAQVAQLGLGLGAMVSKTFRKYAGIAQVGVEMLFLSFSRADEREADALGVEYSAKAGYDSNHMANIFVSLERLNPGAAQGGLPGWFSTHPNPPDRIAAIQRDTLAWRAKIQQTKFAVNHDPYLNQVNGITFGEDPRQGYVEDNIFYHPQLRFQFPVPAGWKVNNTSSQVQMVNQDQSAIILFSMASEKSPSDAARAFINESKAVVVKSEKTQVNGSPAQRIIADVTTEQGLVRALTYFIQKEKTVYVFLGYSAQARFDGNFPVFDRTMVQFKNLTDSRKINVKADRLILKRTPTQGSLRQALRNFGEPEDQWEALAIINGMKLDDALPGNTIIKVVVK
ncbi:MAG: M48 family metalloprotease [Candidatus Aminicenantes bacterium]|nr:M48 family metalloprotease [Candidatus Aminicenantes bacterium]